MKTGPVYKSDKELDAYLLAAGLCIKMEKYLRENVTQLHLIVLDAHPADKELMLNRHMVGKGVLREDAENVRTFGKLLTSMPKFDKDKFLYAYTIVKIWLDKKDDTAGSNSGWQSNPAQTYTQAKAKYQNLGKEFWDRKIIRDYTARVVQDLPFLEYKFLKAGIANMLDCFEPQQKEKIMGLIEAHVSGKTDRAEFEKEVDKIRAKYGVKDRLEATKAQIAQSLTAVKSASLEEAISPQPLLRLAILSVKAELRQELSQSLGAR